jgi:hypothetical protein
MTGTQCPHCGQSHPAGTTFCSATGRPLQAQPAASPAGQPPPQGYAAYGQAPQAPYPHGQQGQPPPQGYAPPGYGPPGGYAPAPGAYGPPPAPGGYGPPGPSGYGPPPGPGGYGPPPGPGGYGAPAAGYGVAQGSGGYGGAPQGAGGYGPPPRGGYGPPPGQGAYGGPQQPQYGQPPPYGGYGQPAQGYAQGAPGQYGAPGLRAAKPVGVILTEAFQLYQKHIGTLLLTCAILLVPVSLAKSAAVALILAPTAVVDVAATRAQTLSQRTAQDLQRQLQETDPKKREALARDQQKEMQDLQQAWVTTGTAAVGGLMAIVLGLVAALIGIAVMYGIAIPLTTGALTIIVADRSIGGTAGPGMAYSRLLRRFGKLLSAAIPAFFLVLVGLCFLVIPGVILGFLFVFVTPIVLLENVGGIAALKRSVALVKANVPQVAIVCLVFAAIRIVASIMSGIFVSRSALFVGGLVQDALTILILPIPILGTVLLYLDIRRQTEGLDDAGIRAALGS